MIPTLNGNHLVQLECIPSQKSEESVLLGLLGLLGLLNPTPTHYGVRSVIREIRE